MPAPLFTMPLAQWMDPSGVPFIGGQLSFYISGTDNAAAVYADAGLTTPLSQPVQSLQNGYWPPIYLNPGVTYKVVLLDVNDDLIWTAPAVSSGGSGGLSLSPIITSGPLFTGLTYGARTSLGALNLTLPALSSVINYQGLEIIDIENDAAANNITVTAYAGDIIAYLGGTSGTFVLDTNSACARIFCVNGVWRAITYA